MKKYSNFDDEVEQYESRGDYLAILFIGITVTLAIVMVIADPDVEAIGTWISSHIN